MRKYLVVSTTLALVLFLGGFIGALSQMNIKDIIDKVQEIEIGVFDKNETYTYTEIIDNIDIDINAGNSEIHLKQMDIDYIEVNTRYSEDNEYEVTYINNTLKITKPEKYNFPCFFCNINNGGIVEVVIPIDIINNINIDVSNGLINVDDINAKNVIVETSNGKLSFKNINANMLTSKTSNGIVVLENIEVLDNIYVKSSNGKIEANDINANNKIELRTSNGIIETYNVYSYDVYLKTSNGNVSLINDDLEYQIERLTVETSNGKETVQANAKFRE